MQAASKRSAGLAIGPRKSRTGADSTDAARSTGDIVRAKRATGQAKGISIFQSASGTIASRASRTAIGVAMMPYNAAIEVEAQFWVR